MCSLCSHSDSQAGISIYEQGDIPIKDIPLFFIDLRQDYTAISVDSFFFSGS